MEEEPSLKSGRNWAGKSQVKRYKFPITRENEGMEEKECESEEETREEGMGDRKKKREGEL